MCALTVSYCAKVMQAVWDGHGDGPLDGVAIDSRAIKRGDLFVAVEGARVNGHAFVEEAAKRGAVAVVASQPVQTSLPVLRVTNTVLALGALAKDHRRAFSIPTAAVTGSCGKTTVKGMLANIASLAGPVLATHGNLNTDIGVPLTLLRLQETHKMAVIEMGARRQGDIAYLMTVTSPTVSLITNAGSAHKEIFGSEAGIARAKGEIFEHLNPAGSAILNLDDPNSGYWQGLLKGQQCITFGLSKGAIRAETIVEAPRFSQFDLMVMGTSLPIRLPVPGRHNIYNALAAAAAAYAMGCTLHDIQAGLASFVPVTQRLDYKMGCEGACIIDDTYNANPVSVRAALSVLVQQPGKRIFVMGDMFELGSDADDLHRSIGKDAKALGVDKVFGLGERTAFLVDSFGAGGTHYTEKQALIDAVKLELDADTTVLIKGSRGMRMEEVVQQLVQGREGSPTC